MTVESTSVLGGDFFHLKMWIMPGAIELWLAAQRAASPVGV